MQSKCSAHICASRWGTSAPVLLSSGMRCVHSPPGWWVGVITCKCAPPLQHQQAPPERAQPPYLPACKLDWFTSNQTNHHHGGA
eukprot:1162049-Pelagomonas_calceolata.AAC.6